MKKEEQKITKEDRGKIDSLRSIIEEAEKSIYSARATLLRMEGDSRPTSIKKTYGASPDGKIVEGIFDGQIMIGHDGKQYPVPANYASKSKLVEGDMLKLTITDDGNFIYKQIGPVERKRFIGLVREDESGNFAIEAEEKLYKVLLASVTYYKAQPGDEVTIIVPRSGEPVWCSIENVTKKAFQENAPINEEMDPFIKREDGRAFFSQKKEATSNGGAERFVVFGGEEKAQSEEIPAIEEPLVEEKIKKTKKIVVRKKPVIAPTPILTPTTKPTTKIEVKVEDEEELKGSLESSAEVPVEISAENVEVADSATKKTDLTSGKMEEIIQEWTPAMEDLEKEALDAKESADKAQAEEDVLDAPVEKESFQEKIKIRVKGEDVREEGIVQKEFPDTPEEILKN
jgi:hypothetical protein